MIISIRWWSYSMVAISLILLGFSGGLLGRVNVSLYSIHIRM
ncbi:MAG: hypothetical protein V3T96_05995 [Thermodesulfobacteriota bacterium]